MKRPVVLAVTFTLVLLLVPVGSPAAEPAWTVTDLGSLGGGGTSASAINDRGQVVGTSLTVDGVSHGFIWEKGVMADLGTLGLRIAPTSLNERGQVVGRGDLTSEEERGFFWDDGVMTVLETLGGAGSYATDINRSGQVVGASTTTGGETHAFLWEDGVMKDLGTLGGSYSVANDKVGVWHAY